MGGIVGNTGSGSVLLLDGVVIGADLGMENRIKGEGSAYIGDGLLRRSAGSQHKGGIGLIQAEAELAVDGSSALQQLCTADNIVGFGEDIVIAEGSGIGVHAVNFYGGGQHATVFFHRHDNRAGGSIVNHTGHTLVLFGQGVDILAGNQLGQADHRIACSISGDRHGGCIVRKGQVFQLEVEQIQRNIHAGIVLTDDLDNLDVRVGSCHIVGVDKILGNGGAADGGIAHISNAEFQGAVGILIGDADNEQASGGVVAHAGGGAACFRYTEVVLTDTQRCRQNICQREGVAFAGLCGCLRKEGVRAGAAGGAGDVLMQRKGKRLIRSVGAVDIHQGLGAGNGNRGLDGSGAVNIDEMGIVVAIGLDRAGQDSFHRSIAGNIGDLGYGVSSSCGDTQDGDGLIVLQLHREAAVCSNGNFLAGDASLIHLILVAGGVGGKLHLEGKDLAGHCSGQAVKAVVNVLNDGQIAVLVGCIGDRSGHELHAGADGLADQRNGNGVGLAGDVVIAIHILVDGADRAAGDAADIYGLACLNLHSKDIAAVGKVCGIAVLIHNGRLSGNACRHGNGQRIGIACIADGLGDLLGQDDAGFDLHGQLAVVAQPDDHIVAVMVLLVLQIFGGVAFYSRFGVVGDLIVHHIVQAAGAAGADAQDRVQLGIGIGLQICGDGGSHLILRDGLAVVQIGLGIVVIERHGFFQIQPIGVDQIGNLLSSICCIGGAGSGMIICNIGVDLIGILNILIVLVGHPVQIIIIIPHNTVLIIFRDGNGFSVFIYNGGEDALILLMIVVSVLRRGLEANVAVALEDCAGAVGGIFFAKLVGIEGNGAVGIVNVGIALQLGNIHLAVGQQDVGIHADGIHHPQRLLLQLGDGRSCFIANGFGIDLFQSDGQDLLIDADLQLLGAVSFLDHGDPDILGSIPILVGGGVGAGGFGNGVGAVSMLDNAVGSAEQGDGLDLLDLHILADIVRIDQRRVIHTGAAGTGGAAGNGVECSGGQLLVNLRKYKIQLVAGNIVVLIHIVDVLCHFRSGHSGAGGEIVIKGPCGISCKPVSLPDGYCVSLSPVFKLFISLFDSTAAVAAVERIGRIHQRIGKSIVFQVHSNAVNFGRLAIMLLHQNLVVCRIQQGAQNNTGAAIFVVFS